MTSSGDTTPTAPSPVIVDDFVTIYQMDSTDMGLVIPKASVSLIVTSPPYPGVPQPEPEYHTFPDPKDFNAAHAILRGIWQACYESLEDLGRLVINCYDIPTGDEGMFPNMVKITKDCLEIGFRKREEFIWDKGAGYSPPHGSWPYPKGVLAANTFEPCLVFQKPLQFSQRRKDPKDYPEEIREASKLGSVEHDWLMNPIWKITADREGRSMGHPFTFPEPLVERFVKLYTYEGDIILDPFMGSGTTAEVGRKLKRPAIGFELSDKYIEIMKKRFSRMSMF